MGIVLKVHQAFRNDVGKAIARLDSKAMSELNVSPGDIVKLKGKKETAAIVWPAHQEDEGLGIIRIDGILRNNAGVGIGDRIQVEKIEVKAAKKVILAPKIEVNLTGSFNDYVKRKIMNLPISKGDILPIGVFGTTLPLLVIQTNPQNTVMVNEATVIEIKQAYQKDIGNVPTVTYDDIGGLSEAIQKIREMVELPLRHPELFERVGIEPPKGVLLYGPPGTGKTLLAKAVANESDASFFYIGGPEIVSKYMGESEQRLRQIFKEAQEKAPAIIFIDEIDAIAPKREETQGEVERRVVAQLLTLMDGLKSRGQVIVIGATNRPDSLDPALRRPGRFDREIEIGVPDRKGRFEILQIHTRNMPLSHVDKTLAKKEKDKEKVNKKSVEILLKELATLTHGYTGADLSALVKEAAIKALRRVLPEINVEEDEIPREVLEKIVVKREDFMNALKEISPSALREVYIERPNVKWTDIGGLDEVKKELKESIELPLKNPEKFEMFGIRPPKGVLLYGPPGTGKTLLAKAVANESDANFIAINGPEILSKWVGESEKAIREIFRKARQAAPTIIFIDEIDAIAGKRGADIGSKVTERVVNTLLTEMDGMRSSSRVFVLAATNRHDMIDPALLRPGRFDKVIEIGIPDEKVRLEILKIHTKKMPLDKDVDLKEIAKLTTNFTGADLENIVREAAMHAIRTNSKTVKQDYFIKALENMKNTNKDSQKGEMYR